MNLKEKKRDTNNSGELGELQNCYYLKRQKKRFHWLMGMGEGGKIISKDGKERKYFVQTSLKELET